MIAFKTLIGLFCATALFWVGVAYEHRPKDWPSYTLHCCLVVNVRLGLPESLGAQLADARAALARSEANEAVLEHAITGQNAAIQAEAAAGARALARAETDVAAYRASSPAAAGRLRILAAPIAGDDMCARVKAFDGTFTGALSQ
jgi:hypothetical protein